MFNQVIEIGRLARDPELQVKGETKYCSCSIAVDRFGKDRERTTDWIRFTVFGSQAENLAKYMRKGSLILVEGRLQTSTYERDGKNISSMEFIASRISYLSQGKRAEGSESQMTPAASAGTDDIPDSFTAAVEDIPF